MKGISCSRRAFFKVFFRAGALAVLTALIAGVTGRRDETACQADAFCGSCRELGFCGRPEAERTRQASALEQNPEAAIEEEE